jgi:hypothetical protein
MMADNTYRPFRSRDPIAGEDVDPLAGDIGRDPLAELARLIGQGSQFDRSARSDSAVETLDDRAPAPDDRDWATADRDYAAPHEPERYADDAYAQPRLPEAYPSDRDDAGYDAQRAPAQHYAEPADNYDDPHDAAYHAPYGDERHDDDTHANEASYQPRYPDEEAPSAVRQPSLAPQADDDEYQPRGRWADGPDEPSDEEYEEDDTATAPRRRGLAFIAAMLGLVLVGASGAVAYRAMFGGAILAPTLPPIIKAGDGPNKIVPKQADAQSVANQAGAGNGAAPEKLVSREEQPVAVQPPNAPPRVVSTIPVPPQGGAAPPAGVFPAPPSTIIAPAPMATVPAAAPPRAAAPGQPAPSNAAGGVSSEPKKIHTVAIRPDQPGSGDAAAAAPSSATPAAPAARARTPEPVRPAPAPRSANAPLSLVPGAPAAPSAAAAEPPRRHEARSEPPSASVATAPAATAPAGGGYAVQVSSQRSEAEAQSAFRALAAKFPGQLGNRVPIIRRVELGQKGTYYRAMIGPFASSEAAANMCNGLKAAGGSCLVQKN